MVISKTYVVRYVIAHDKSSPKIRKIPQIVKIVPLLFFGIISKNKIVIVGIVYPIAIECRNLDIIKIILIYWKDLILRK